MGSSDDGNARAQLEARWIELTRRTLPSLAASRDFPVRHDHCFQRILLDAACEGPWYDHVSGRPAYRAIDSERLERATELAQAVAAGEADLAVLNIQSLLWRGKLAAKP